MKNIFMPIKIFSIFVNKKSLTLYTPLWALSQMDMQNFDFEKTFKIQSLLVMIFFWHFGNSCVIPPRESIHAVQMRRASRVNHEVHDACTTPHNEFRIFTVFL